MAKSEIQSFYQNQNVFITGGTGFLGKVLIEKLLRSTPVAKLYILIREKKGQNVQKRLDEMFDDVIFEPIKKLNPKFREKIVGISGDCSITGLGLNLENRQQLISKVNIIFHVAASVRFVENIKFAYTINVNSIRDILELSKQMKQLKSLIHVSTAYSNCHVDKIEEKFYDYPMNYEEIGTLLEKLTDKEANKLTPKIIGKWPNTYTFTKALAEELIRYESDGIPVGIFRPAIIISTYQEPIPGWINNLYGPTGITTGTYSGLIRAVNCDSKLNCDLVPVDMCASALIASAWDIGQKSKTGQIKIYNYISSVENPIIWGEYSALNALQEQYYPYFNSVWALTFWSIKNDKLFHFVRFFYHTLPAVIMDAGLVLMGKQPKFVKLYKKIHQSLDVLSFFSTKDWKFRNDNTVKLYETMNEVDQKLFPFSISSLNWLKYFRTYILGVRTYVLKDPLDTLHQAKLRRLRMRYLHNIAILVIYFIGFLAIWTILNTLFDWVRWNIF